MEDIKHDVNKSLLIESLSHFLAGQGRKACVAGNAFIYYEQGDPKKCVGPDYFVVVGARPDPDRDCWRMWNEGGQSPQVIVEFLSKSNQKKDRVTNFALYRDVLKVQHYFMCDNRRKMKIEGFSLEDGAYRPMEPDRNGRFFCESLGLHLGFHEGWLRWFLPDGRLVPSRDERGAESERRAEAIGRNVDELLKRHEDEVKRHKDEVKRHEDQVKRQQEEMKHQKDEAEHRASEEAQLRRQAEDRLARLEEELRRLRGDPS